MTRSEFFKCIVAAAATAFGYKTPRTRYASGGFIEPGKPYIVGETVSEFIPIRNCYLESRQFTVGEICRVFNVPPHMVVG